MKADKTKMFSMPIGKVRPEDSAPFPIYIFLQRNNRMVPVWLQGDSIKEEVYNKLLGEKHEELWVPRIYEKEFSEYVKYLERTTNPASQQEPDAIRLDREQKIAELSGKVKKLLRPNSKNPDSEKQLASLATAILREIKTIEKTEISARIELAGKSQVLADEILRLDPEHALFEGVVKLRSIQQPTAHSIFVGSLAALFALSAGITDVTSLSEIIVAATFHDIGFTQISPNLLRQKRKEHTAEEKREYESHAEKSAEFLENSEDSFPPNVIRMVREHHLGSSESNYVLSKYLQLANQFDNLCCGTLTGDPVSPKIALNQLSENSSEDWLKELILAELPFP